MNNNSESPAPQRVKVWTTSQQVQMLAVAISNHLERYPGDTVVRSLHDEVAVARVRYEHSTDNPALLCRALGREQGDIPLSLTLPERALLLTMPETAPALRIALTKTL